MNFTPLWTAALNAFSNFIIVDERCRIAYMKSWLPAKLTSVH